MRMLRRSEFKLTSGPKKLVFITPQNPSAFQRRTLRINPIHESQDPCPKLREDVSLINNEEVTSRSPCDTERSD